MISKNVAAAILAALVLAGCGTTPSDRMLSGGLLGAGAGAAIGSVTGGVGTGAVIGAVSGAALGGLTHPRDVYLGEPPWHHSAGYYHHHHYAYSCRQTSANEKVCRRVATR